MRDIASGAEEKYFAMSFKEMHSFTPTSTKPATAAIAPMSVNGSIENLDAEDKAEDRVG